MKRVRGQENAIDPTKNKKSKTKCQYLNLLLSVCLSVGESQM